MGVLPLKSGSYNAEQGRGGMPMDNILQVNERLRGLIWGAPMLILLLGTGLYFTAVTGVFQVRYCALWLRKTLFSCFTGAARRTSGGVSPFAAMCTALAATVGTGNITGVATAIALGGPGAVFWMWISAVFGMMTKFSEVVLSVHFREKNQRGENVGGPMYYLEKGLHLKWLAVLFAIFAAFASFGIGNMTQSNAISTALQSTLGINPYLTGAVIVVIAAIVLLGGIQSIAKVTSTLVPIMGCAYAIFAILALVANAPEIPHALAVIFEGAFHPQSIAGGVAGYTVLMAIRFGVARGVFSNEAGLGTGSIAHACADTKKPVKQGMFGIFEVFADTIVICTLTALVILCSGTSVSYGAAAGAELTISGFTTTYGGWASIFTAVALCCFAFSTIIGWGLYGTRCVEFLLGTRANRPFMILYALVAIVGATMELGLMWNIAETFNGLMAIPNLIGIFLLSGTAIALTKEYFAKK